SMLQDLKNKKPCEVDAINGVVCSCGKKKNIPTPINDRIVDVIKKIQSGALEAKFENIRLFDDLLK
ncbi:MAG: 2-dehydropantoate 2-reductase, partial [Clostridia bacterium]|nr:2-dehydropantoate 2-reductase [Clostridia bacterium]MBR3905282.1 2-dehydropantoate 2-reductase [Clostridia bacterium]